MCNAIDLVSANEMFDVTATTIDARARVISTQG